MRIAAGILMILGGIMAYMIPRMSGFSVGWIPEILTTLIFSGGYYTLRRKNWGWCLFSSSLLLPFLALPFLAWPDGSDENPITLFAISIILLWIMIGVLPVITMFLKKREWESIYSQQKAPDHNIDIIEKRCSLCDVLIQKRDEKKGVCWGCGEKLIVNKITS